MSKKLWSMSGVVILTICLLTMYTLNQSRFERDSVVSARKGANKSDSEFSQPQSSSSEIQYPNSRTAGTGGADGAGSSGREIDLVMAEVSMRLLEYQTDEALNELNALLDIFDELSDSEKADVLKGFATYFTRLNQFDDAIFFYEASLDLPNLDTSGRLSVLQLLARFALYEENWDAFLSYNDQYFAEGGEYNWYVTSQLVNAYQRLGDAEAAGDALLLHLQTGIDPQFENSDDRYQQLYGETQYLPLMMSDPVSALDLAQSLVEQFNRAENWKVLADLYQMQANELKFNGVVRDAQERGFVDSSGNWILPSEEIGTN